MDDASVGQYVPERCVPTPINSGSETMGQQIRCAVIVMQTRFAVIVRRALTATLFSLVSQGYIERLKR
jgi:hypothetical protein